MIQRSRQIAVLLFFMVLGTQLSAKIEPQGTVEKAALGVGAVLAPCAFYKAWQAQNKVNELRDALEECYARLHEPKRAPGVAGVPVSNEVALTRSLIRKLKMKLKNARWWCNVWSTICAAGGASVVYGGWSAWKRWSEDANERARLQEKDDFQRFSDTKRDIIALFDRLSKRVAGSNDACAIRLANLHLPQLGKALEELQKAEAGLEASDAYKNATKGKQKELKANMRIGHANSLPKSISDISYALMLSAGRPYTQKNYRRVARLFSAARGANPTREQTKALQTISSARSRIEATVKKEREACARARNMALILSSATPLNDACTPQLCLEDGGEH